MAAIPPGALIEFSQGKGLTVALCLRPDKPGRVFVRTLENREEKLAESKALFVTPGFLEPSSAPERILEALRGAAREREELAGSLPLAELWELLGEEPSEAGFSLDELAGLQFPAPVGAFERAALYRALEADAVYFNRKGDRYLLRSAAAVEETLTRLQAEESRGREREVLARWLAELWGRPEGVAGAVAAPEGFEEAVRRCLTWIRDVALHGPEARRHKEVGLLLKEAGISRRDAPFQIMVRAGVWSEHENLVLHRFRIPQAFSPELTAEARRLEEEAAPLGDPGREDLRHLECFTIDDATTTEIDDALSVERIGEGRLRVGIHIADASAYVLPESPLDLEARARATAVYLPDLKIRMLPEPLSDEACSLVAGADRPAFSFLVECTLEGELIEARMATSLIRVRERHTYESADRALEEGRWADLYGAALGLRAGRKGQGAVTVPFPRVNVKVTPAGEVRIEREAANAPSQVLVSELMILANRLAGELLVARGAAAVFRSQEAPEKPIEDLEEFEPHRAYAMRRYLRRGALGTSPARHHGLGLDHYTQVTSPIRRYQDLLMQRQLKALLGVGAPLYTAEELDALLAGMRGATDQADQAEKDRRSYWTLRYLEERLWQELEAVVVANHPDKHVVQISECLWETDCPHVPGRPLPPGTRLAVRIELVWPRDGVVRVTPVLAEEEEEEENP